MAINQTPLSADQIEYMVGRFLSWTMPVDEMTPDGGISITRPNYGAGVPWTVSGTNLLGYDQAKAMVLHMAEGMPAAERVVG